MKFKFCGGGDCPEWLLVQINALSRMFEKAKELMADAKLEGENCKACVAAITFILKNSACHAVPQNYLTNELQQIGLPREHALALCKVYSDNLPEITKALKNSSLQIGRVKDVDVSKETDDEYSMKLKFSNALGKLEEKKFAVTKEQIQLLIAEFSDVAERMTELAHECKQ
ncbi:COMM domain-containing protein 4 isoform X2 [Adelges cooleyi]|uniref:COMM domain-containing protein 4 isoform X2 n=1 Tax=Adelges cooleyi TaxID=133065 RepID=UPI00217FE1CD|nr:COMM domain-containing protein 4 isoform X2 [Adelges cooleyi]